MENAPMGSGCDFAYNFGIRKNDPTSKRVNICFQRQDLAPNSIFVLPAKAPPSKFLAPCLTAGLTWASGFTIDCASIPSFDIPHPQCVSEFSCTACVEDIAQRVF